MARNLHANRRRRSLPSSRIGVSIEFNAAYRKARRAAFSQSVARLQQASGAAVSTLLKVMVDPNAPPSTKVRAADSVLNHGARAIELEDIDVRVTELERAAEASKPGWKR